MSIDNYGRERERLQRKGRKGVVNQLTRTLYTLLFIQKKNNVVIRVTHTHTHTHEYIYMHAHVYTYNVYAYTQYTAIHIHAS